MHGTEQAIHHPAKPPFQRMRKLTHSLKYTHTSSSSLLLLQVCSSFDVFFLFLKDTSISATPFFHFIPSFFFALQAHSSSFSFSSHPHLTLLLLIHIHSSSRESHTSSMVILPRQIIDSTTECEQCTKEHICPTHALACTGTLNAVR